MGSASVAGAARKSLGPVGVYLPVPFTSTPPVSRQREAVARLERAGYRTAWVNETVGGKDPLVQLALLLPAAGRMPFGTGVANIWARAPQTAHGAAAMLAQAYPGRLQAMLAGRYTDQTPVVINQGVSGETAEDGAPRFVRAIRNENPEAVLLLEGVNDIAGQQDRGASLALAALDSMLREARNRRVAVFDKEGKFLRQWGRQATEEETRSGAPGVFAEVVHCIAMNNAGLIYVCDRQGNRVQVFQKDGTFVRNIAIPNASGKLPDKRGTAWWVAFSPDREQKLLYVMNGGTEQVHILDHASGKILSSFGRPGHQAGNFTHGHTIAVDSKGNVYVAETDWGRRVQKFKSVSGP